MADNYRHGDFLAICDVCGFEYHGSQLKRRWDGAYVCSKDWEPRHPQDYVRGVRDDQGPPFTRPEGTDTFVNQFSTTLGAAAASGDTVLTVADSSDLTTGNLVNIILDDDSMQRTSIASIGGATSITVADALRYPASSGNVVTDIGVAA